MSIIIDGYNLLRTCGYVGDKIGPGTLERARGLFLGLLAQALSPQQRQNTHVVFDSALRLPELPDQYEQDGIQVYFASGHQDADEMIIEMIQRDSAPKSLEVVSSDHQIQIAAKRRKAKSWDSDVWLERLLQQSQDKPGVQLSAEQLKTQSTLEKKSSSEPLNSAETETWLAQFLQTPTSGAAKQPTEQPSRSPGSQIAASADASVDKQQKARSSESPTSPKTRPQDVPAKAKKSHSFNQTSWDQLAISAKQREDNAPSAPAQKTGDKANRVADHTDVSPSAKKISLDDIAPIDDVPELNLGKSMEQARLKHDMLVPEDLEEWLEDFDKQFQKSGVDAQDSLRLQKEKETRRRPAKEEQPEPSSNAKHVKTESNTVDGSQQRDGQPGKQKPDSSTTGNPAAPAASASASPSADKPTATPQRPINVDEKQLDRWNRQLKETDDEIFPPGYGEDLLFAETFEKDDRLKRKRRK